MMPTIQIADKPTLDTVSSNMASVKSSIENATYGLEAIKNQTNLLSNSTYGLSAIKSAIDGSSGGGSVIKSVQRGTTSLYYLSSSQILLSTTITINSINMNKSILLLSNEINNKWHQGGGENVEGYIKSNTSIYITTDQPAYSTGSYNYVAWQVIEFV